MKYRARIAAAIGVTVLVAVAAAGFVIAFGLAEPAYVATAAGWIGLIGGVAALIKSAVSR